MWHVVGCVVLAGRVWSGWRGCGAWATPGCWPDGWCCVWLAWCDGVGGRFAAVTWVWCAASVWSVFSGGTYQREVGCVVRACAAREWWWVIAVGGGRCVQGLCVGVVCAVAG